MSFGLLKHFKEKKGEETQKQSSKHYQHLILGHDLGAILKLMEIKTQFPQDSVRLISNRPINKQSLIENYDYGVLELRSAEAVEGIYKKYHNAKILPQSNEASFYKDGKFHEFGGRAKSMEILKGEEFFIHKGYKIELSSLFSTENWENLDQIINEHSEIRIFESVEKNPPEDLIEKKEWVLSFKDFATATCEYLYVSMSPKKFLNLFHNKEKLTPELIDFCTSTDVRTAISVTFFLDKEIFQEEKTLFIPQSMTHEWGHFIVEFEQEKCHVLFLIHEDEPQTEDLASKIRLMKRVLDRVFSDIEKHIVKEYIRLDEEMFISNIKDSTAEQLSFDYPTLKFLGHSAPMNENFKNEKFIARTLLN